MKNQFVKNIRIVTVIILLICFGLLSIQNIYNFAVITDNKVMVEDKDLDTVFTDVENTFREQIKNRNDMVNINGIFQKAINHHVEGNFEFVSDEYGVMHMMQITNDYDTKGFVSEIKQLKKYTDKKNVPLLYVQAPNREMANKESAITDFNVDNETMDEVVAGVKKAGVSVLDIRKKLYEEPHDFALTELFFHTDLHMQTDAEIWMINQVAKYLDDEMKIKIKNRDYLEDMTYYDKKTYEFVGSYSRTYGKYFVKSDMFDIYHPKFETSYTYKMEGDDNITGPGDFNTIMLNGYENNPYDEYTYWVTNYMHFTLPSYTYVNNMQNDVKLLVLTDSIAYRGLAYLSLATNKITILDPRFYGNIDYTKLALENEEYDAVIVIQGNYLIGNELIF